MRVLFLTHAYPRSPGDTPGAFLHLLARALHSTGVEVHVLAPHAAGLAMQETMDGIQVHRFRYAADEAETLAYTGRMVEEVRASLQGKVTLARLMAAGTRASRHLARSLQVDVLHAHWWFPNGVIAAATSRLTSLPLVTTLHGSDVRLARGVAPMRAAFRAVARRSAAVTAVSHFLARSAKEMATDASVSVLPMPVDVERFRLTTDGAPRSRDSLLFVGRLSRQKGTALALQALAQLPPHVLLDVVGDGPERDSLQRQAASLGIASRVRWHGALPASELPERYREAAAVVIPSHEEGLGLVAVEAVLCGAPVVAFASGGLVDALDDGRSGTLVPPGDVPALAAALASILESPHAARARAVEGRANALARHDPAIAAKRYRELYECVLASH